jgi:hypothetical protein
VWRVSKFPLWAITTKDHEYKNNLIYFFVSGLLFLGNLDELPNFLAKLKSSQRAKKPKVIP